MTRSVAAEFNAEVFEVSAANIFGAYTGGLALHPKDTVNIVKCSEMQSLRLLFTMTIHWCAANGSCLASPKNPCLYSNFSTNQAGKDNH